MERPKSVNPTYILNVSGGHGHFLQWILDKFCVSTPTIDTLPFNKIGQSHLPYKSSGAFEFVDDPQTQEFLKSNRDLNCIMITIDDEILYWERSCIYRAGGRAGDIASDLFDEQSISQFLNKNGSSFPKFCEDNRLTIKEGYKFAFMDPDNAGTRIHDNERKTYKGVEYNNVYFFPIKNFISKQNLRKALADTGAYFGFDLDLSDFSSVYDTWYNQNTLLQTYDNTQLYLNGNKDVKLDVLQQAYVDALEN